MRNNIKIKFKIGGETQKKKLFRLTMIMIMIVIDWWGLHTYTHTKKNKR